MKKETVDIAIVGMSCRFPGAKNYNEYWENLLKNTNSISEIPADRWSWQDYYEELEGNKNTTKIKWGGFIQDVDKFDPLFFKISPKEANYMDPQHRLILESIWHAIEDAGYNPRSLAGKKIGVYVGVSKNDYAELMRETKESIISFVSTGTVHSIIANRVSYLLDFTGKSEVVDTACSSFMVALNNAVRDIQLGICESAVVGGVNAILTPTMYISHSKSGMLSHDGVCRSFDEKANGYVRGEGVGVVFLKPLDEAKRDGDDIWGVIKGIAVAHGGKSTSLTAPRASSQAAVVDDAIKKSGIPPETITYIEAHGTGTPLGDPIEIEALKIAYAEVKTDNNCAIGAVKTNIGHLESAAGVAGLIKILLAFKHKLLPSMLNFNKLNPYIELQGSPFYIVEKNTEWHNLNNAGNEIPLRAGLSSFGMGGVNAHAVFEDKPLERKPIKNKIEKTAILISAQTDGQLKDYVDSILKHIKSNVDINLNDLSYTLMFGREAMDSRVAFIADNIETLQEAMQDFLDEKPHPCIVNTNKNLKKEKTKLEVTAQDWISRELVDWSEIYKTTKMEKRRIHLPVYPFKKIRCWFQGSTIKNSFAEEKNKLDQANLTKNINEKNTFTINDYYIRDHVVKGENIVPGVKYLDIFLTESERGVSSEVSEINDVFWVKPIKVRHDISPKIELNRNVDTAELSVKINDAIYCTGKTKLGKRPIAEAKLNIAEVKKRCNENASSESLYELFIKNGLMYGDTFRVIKNCNFNNDEIICELHRHTQSPTEKIIEPSIADGVFQTVAALYLLNNLHQKEQLLPYYLKEMKVYAAMPDKCIVYAHRNENSGKENIESYNMYLCNDSGELIAEFKEFIKRKYEKSKDVDNITSLPLLTYTSRWVTRSLGMHCENLSAVIVFENGRTFLDKAKDSFKNAFIIQVKSGRSFKKISNKSYIVNAQDADSFSKLWNSLKEDNIQVEGVIYAWNINGQGNVRNVLNLGIKAVFFIIKTLILAKNNFSTRILYFYQNHSTVETTIHSMIGGFSRTLAYENPNITLESIGYDSADDIDVAAIACQELTYYNNAPLYEIRYQKAIREAKVITARKKSDKNDGVLLRKNGTYLITGGAGGLGFIFATYLAKEYQANLILVGRTTFSLSHERKIEELIKLGSHAQYIQSDVGDGESIKKLSAALQLKNIELNGVIHCAGMIDDAFIIKKTSESFDKVIAAKVLGTINLDDITKKHKLDLFVVFSSIASIMPNQGQSDYASANAFLDEFTNYRNSLSQKGERYGKSIGINWPLWRDGGIGVNNDEEEHLKNFFGMFPLETESGIEIFLEALVENNEKTLDGQVIAIKGDEEKINKHLQVFNDTGELKNQTVSEKLKKVIHAILNQKKAINNVESFSELGLDSIGVLKFTSTVNKLFDLELKPTILFEYDSIFKLSNYLQNLSVNKASILNPPPLPLASNFLCGRSLIDLERSDLVNLEFSKGFSQKEYFMKDHIVDGKYNVPGACYIEMAVECGEMIPGNGKVFRLANNYWAKQLSTTGGIVEARLKLLDKGEFYEYEISSMSNDESVLHAVGQLYVSNNSQIDLGYINLAELKSKYHIHRRPQEIYQFIHAEGLHVGPSFMPMLNIALNEEEALSHLKLPDLISETAVDYIFHPSLLTGVLQTALLNNKPNGIEDTHFIPIAIDEIVFVDKIPSECYVYTQTKKTNNLNNGIAKFDAKILNLEGKVIVSIQGLTLRNLTAMKNFPMKPSTEQKNGSRNIFSSDDSTCQVENLLKETLRDSIGLPVSDIDSNVDLEAYGINSVMIVELNKALGKIFGNLSKTLFFEYKNIKELAGYFIESHQNILSDLLSKNKEIESSNDTDGTYHDVRSDVMQDVFIHEPNNGQTYTQNEDIAIIGVGGKYPQAANLSQFWENLKLGKDCVTDMPKWRFDYEKFYRDTNDSSMLSAKWGGFLDDIDKFDPQFFNISPKRADLIDPQERLFLEVAWETVESAGYNHESLRGRSIGVFVGALWQPYTALAIEQTINGNPQAADGLLYNIPNRVSFFFDWSGPSLVIDTACSSSLSALHFACESLRQGDCEAALVGGVNLSFSSDKYFWLAKNNFLSSDGKCRSFGANGDGYVPGEGVGAVFIKKLSDAIRDGDSICGVIKATAVNHGGKTNGYTVPNPNRQADLIFNALNKSNISPDQIDYIEAHGTGTSLGDPIEVAGIKKAFSKYPGKENRCAIGSVKSNIGHLEAAAGIAGLTKILLQMKHDMLVPSLHADVFNPNIDFENSFLAVQRELSMWARKRDELGRVKPHCAMLSSFGAGGSNAHAIIEEYIPKLDSEHSNAEESYFIFPISAVNKERLQAYAEKILYFIENYSVEEIRCKKYANDSLYLRDLAYTFQVARSQQNERLIVIVKSFDELKENIRKYLLAPDQKVDGVYTANVKTEQPAFRLLFADTQLNQIFDAWVKGKNHTKIAGLWLSGMDVNWSLLYKEKQVKRIDAPTYPFKRESYWMKQMTSQAVTHSESKQSKLHPLLHKNTSDFFGQKYSSIFKIGDPILVKHNDKEKYVLPNLITIEMFHEAILLATSNRENIWSIENVHWRSPILIVDDAQEVHTNLSVIEDDGENVSEVYFEQYSILESDVVEKLIHSSGTIKSNKNICVEKVDIPRLEKENDFGIIEMQSYYQDLKECGIECGEEKSRVSEIKFGNDRILAKINTQKYVQVENFSIHPELLLSVMEIIKFVMIKIGQSPREFVNIKSIKNVEFFRKLNSPSYIYAHVRPGVESIFNIYILDRDGNVNIKLTGLVVDDKKFYNGPQITCSPAVENNKSLICDDCVSEFLIDSLASVLGSRVTDIEIDKPFIEMGLDSIGALTWIEAINENYGITINETKIYDYPNINEFSRYIISIVDEEKISNLEFVKSDNQISNVEEVNEGHPSSHDYDSLLDFLVESVASALGVPIVDIEIDKAFVEMGLDSISAVVWIDAINTNYDCAINETKVYDYPNLLEFSKFLINEIRGNKASDKQSLESLYA
ncbi:SDR family NAD(P)-dependent oxidoreductase [Chromobacterium piscinae]|uniref:SDR family NAD(P)-dependent oxidoreductase n=1 Tax=Chromobacterium piscinae TaxID=686831 RepID=UPI001E2E1256|nr:SDR family NAD(P)-dependent oxidoreductase [Chromobacterium piscinae]MCD4503427.1 SDR family NAD(P)-dependent oxidoreductase [Chromobacterium piscinae]